MIILKVGVPLLQKGNSKVLITPAIIHLCHNTDRKKFVSSFVITTLKLDTHKMSYKLLAIIVLVKEPYRKSDKEFLSLLL